MWTRDDPRTTADASEPADIKPQPAAAPQAASTTLPPPSISSNIGRSVIVKGQLTGSQDLTIEGRVEGSIDLSDHELTVGPNATIEAEIIAKTVTIFGSVIGNVTARDALHLRHGGSLEGNIVCRSLAIQDRAHFCGTVNMGRRRADSDTADDGEAPRSAAVA